ncbi:hypothetical protein E4634_00585 [Mangrovimicrobium sediminis]|uniref:Uncharacterized protein n=1 Tax=Mangrovimicrobium sediminis TaxID=2562682 RepID=A0A4Z0M975_9GAMM|nr:hypothetical protein [Haliea sp. SAOS-164]TGD76081.1 hypothetical protein E4634_00585 [Haliea sp. SAOS-164]
MSRNLRLLACTGVVLGLSSVYSLPASGALSLSCSLPYTHGKPGKDCTGKHTIEIQVAGGSPQTEVQAELLALDPNGVILGALPVENHDPAHLRSRIDEDDYSLRTTNRGVHVVAAPIPLLSVTAVDGDETVHAYCSDVPYLRLYQPTGQVATAGDTVDVVLAATGLEPASLQVFVDGVEIAAALGLTPATDFPGGPYAGNVSIGGENVEITDLVVDLGDIEEPSSNTVSFTLEGLPAGGHVIFADGERLANRPTRGPVSDACHIDDMEDAGQFAVFGVDIESPFEQQVVNAVPTPVSGVVKHGLPIAATKINGAALDVSGQSFVAGDGKFTADQYEYHFDEAIPQTDLRADLDAGSAPLGSFDRGSNRLTVDALDTYGNRAFDELFFAVGGVQSPTAPLETLAANALGFNVERSVSPLLMVALDEAEEAIQNSFVVGLTEDGIQALMDQKCPDAGQAFKESVQSKIAEIAPISKKISGGCSCSPNVEIGITGSSIDANAISCPVTFQDGKIAVSIDLPDVTVYGSAYGHCKDTVAGVCVAETTVDITSTTTISDLSLSFNITEGQFLGDPPEEPVFVTGTSSVSTSGGSDVDCLAEVCNWAIEGIVTIFTFGTVDLDLTPAIDVSQVTEFNQAIGASEPDPIDLGDIKIDEEEVEEFGQASLGGALESVEITPQGFLATLSGNFETLAVDTDVQPTPGAVVDVAPAPTMQIPNAGDATVLLSDEVINQLFSSMAESGGLKTACQYTDKSVDDVLPTDCDALDGAAASGMCHAIRGTDCETLAGDGITGTAIKQGVCHGASGDTCSGIAGSDLERNTCSGTPPTTLAAYNQVLFCSRQDNPPRFLIQDDAGTPATVETAVRLSDLSVAIVVDRDNDGFAELNDTPDCFGSDASVSGDCALYNTCLDLNLVTTSSIATENLDCPAGVPGFVTDVVDFQILNRQEGVVCGAAQETVDGQLVGTSNDDDTVDLIGENVDTYAPPLCVEGLDLGGFVTLQNPKIIAVETDGDADFQEYIGITGEVAAP